MKMRTWKPFHRMLAWMILGIMMLVWPCGVTAQSHSEIYGIHSIQISLNAGTKKLHSPEGIRMALYQVAEGSYYQDRAAVVPDFAGFVSAYPEKDLKYIVENTSDASAELQEYVESLQGVEPALTAVSDANGVIDFNNLEDGIYLVVQTNESGDFDSADYTVTVEPYLVVLPRMESDGTLIYDIVTKPKFYEEPNQGQLKTVEVEKHWEDNNDTQGKRPDKIEVVLKRDGEQNDKQVLNAANNWQYVWQGLSSAATWTVEEVAVPEGYTSTVTTEGNTFVITNKLKDNPDKPDNPDNPDKPSNPDNPDKPDNPSNPNNPDNPGNQDNNNPGTSIPGVKTGDVFRAGLYVAVMIAAAIVVAVLLRGRKKKEE